MSSRGKRQRLSIAVDFLADEIEMGHLLASSGGGAPLLEAATQEIRRLRSALATARREAAEAMRAACVGVARNHFPMPDLSLGLRAAGSEVALKRAAGEQIATALSAVQTADTEVPDE